jgi:hypothetical protein
MILYDFHQPADKETLLRQRLAEVTLPDYRPVRNRSNNWGFDATEQKRLTYTGMGLDINVHDQWAVESMGRVQDRTAERLGMSDRAIIAARRLLLRSIAAFEAGQAIPGRAADQAAARALAGPDAADTIVPSDGWQQRWHEHEAERRAASPWAAPTPGPPDLPGAAGQVDLDA